MSMKGVLVWAAIVCVALIAALCWRTCVMASREDREASDREQEAFLRERNKDA